MNKQTIPIKGMHCRSCEILIEDELSKVPGINKVEVSHKKQEAIVYSQNPINNNYIKQAINNAGYTLGYENKKPILTTNINDYLDLAICGVILIILFFFANSFGIFDLLKVTSGNYASLPIVFIVGLTAGLSTCMALVGGLVLGASARFAEIHPTATPIEKFKPHLFFNLGRIISYFILGGIIGYFGSFFQLSPTMLGLLTIMVGIIMFVLGLQLTGLFPRLSSVNFTLPKGIAQRLGIKEHSQKDYSHKNSFISGALTFFLPCGFTQAMQLYAISSGNALTGALTMGIFALGTLPGLLGIGGLTSILKGNFAKSFFKFAGIVVILLAIFNLSNGLNLTGFNINAFSFLNNTTASLNDPNVIVENGVQIVKMEQNGNGYSPNSFTIKKNIPVRWIINSTNDFSCASSIVSTKLNIRQSLKLGANIIEFTPTEIGQINFSCSMGMYTGVFNVIDNQNNPQSINTNNIPTQPVASCSGSGGCGCGTKIQKQAAINADKTPPIEAKQEGTIQIIKATYSVAEDVLPTKFTVKTGSSVQFDIEAKEDGAGCMGSIMIPGLVDTPQGFQKGKITSLEFTPQKPGSYTITCAMGVPRGTIIVD